MSKPHTHWKTVIGNWAFMERMQAQFQLGLLDEMLEQLGPKLPIPGDYGKKRRV